MVMRTVVAVSKRAVRCARCASTHAKGRHRHHAVTCSAGIALQTGATRSRSVLSVAHQRSTISSGPFVRFNKRHHSSELWNDAMWSAVDASARPPRQLEREESAPRVRRCASPAAHHSHCARVRVPACRRRSGRRPTAQQPTARVERCRGEGLGVEVTPRLSRREEDKRSTTPLSKASRYQIDP